MKSRIIKKIIFVLCGVLILVAGLYGYYKLCMDPYRGTVQEFADSVDMDEMLDGEAAKEDLEYLMEHLRERHPVWLDGSEKKVATVEAQYEAEMAEVGEEISVLELYRAAARITAKLQDGHTYVSWYSETQRYIDDFTQIQTYGRPLTIDGVAAEDILEAYKEVASYELDFYVEDQFYSSSIVSEPRLRLCGVDTSDGVIMTFENDGVEIEQTYGFVTADEIKGYEYSGEDSEWVFYEIDKENNVGIFTLSSCIYNEEYLSTLDTFFSEVSAEKIHNVVVDLRGNGGGNSQVANAFINYLNVDEYDCWDSAIRYGWYLLKNEDVTYTNQKKGRVFDGEVYILTDISTFSAAMDFAMLITDNDLGTIVGEPSGNLPDAYGDCLYFQMPNSKLLMSISHKKWSRIDQTKCGQPIMPDYEVPAGEALDKVYELIQ